MKIKSIKANQTELTLNDGTMVFVSYATPVAAFIPGKGIVETEMKWSRTTSRHIKNWIAETFSPNVTREKVPQETLDALI